MRAADSRHAGWAGDGTSGNLLARHPDGALTVPPGDRRDFVLGLRGVSGCPVPSGAGLASILDRFAPHLVDAHFGLTASPDPRALRHAYLANLRTPCTEAGATVTPEEEPLLKALRKA